MSEKIIHIVWSDGRTIDLHLADNPAADYYYRCVRHLQHVDLEFDARKNPLKQVSQDDLVSELDRLSVELNVDIDPTQLGDQSYLNYLHAMYFSQAQHTDFSPSWLRFHDCVHLLEDYIQVHDARSSVWFDFESKAGPLIKPFDRNWLEYATTEITPGMCFLREHELGKNPVLYWRHNEPQDATVNTQAKPWVWLKPVLNIGIAHADNYKAYQATATEFESWFEPIRESWTEHWSVPDWQPKEIFSVIPIGHCDQVNELVDCFTKQDYPIRLAL